MGDYTSLVGVVRIKEEYKELATKFANYEYSDYLYDETKRNEEKYSFVKEFFKTDRADWIPNGDPLGRTFSLDEKHFQNRFENGVWYFSSNLKNYEDEKTGLSPIDSFFINILENIAEEILLLESYPDYHDVIRQYGFSNNGKIVRVNIIDLEPLEYPPFCVSLENIEKEKEERIDVYKTYKNEHNLK